MWAAAGFHYARVKSFDRLWSLLESLEETEPEPEVDVRDFLGHTPRYFFQPEFEKIKQEKQD